MGIFEGGSGKTAASAPKVFISGLERIENIGGGCLEFVMYVNEMVDGKPARTTANFTIVMPADALPDAIGKSLMAIGRTVYARADGVLALMH